ncbi:PE domain-containing protein [Mycobacterium szulgai]|uniref:PE domain-containing protein n=1 Tax=Mycobacterium szulgai TaxID=1787 RepID=UPI0021F39B31|nr:PE domain-containing protein [Mycobacterium szulgai]
MLAQPAAMAAAAADIAGLGSAISEANAAAATRTTGVLAAAPTRCRRDRDALQRLRPGIPGGHPADRGLSTRLRRCPGGCR